MQRDQTRYGEQERPRKQYRVEQQDVATFYALQTQASHTTDSHKALPRQYIPEDKMKIIASVHNHQIGHWGVNRTLELCQEVMERDRDEQLGKKSWKCMRKDVDTFIKDIIL
jgi:Tfp pilus assembly protein PilO